MVKAERAAKQAVKEQLTRATVESDAQILHLRHEIERMADRLEASEANRLDPTVLTNLAFVRCARPFLRTRECECRALPPCVLPARLAAPVIATSPRDRDLAS